MHPEIADVLAGRRGWAVACGDALEVLPTLPAGCVDAVVTDPPYGIAFATSPGRGEVKGAASWLGREIAGDKDTACRDFALSWAHGLPVACFGSWKVARPPDARAVLVWDKGPAFGMGDLSLPWKPSWEEIYILGDGWRGKRDEGVLRGHIVVSWESRGRCHPNEKPVSLILHLLNKLPAARLILDPFAGSGTTGVACLQTGRRFIGVEISPEYAALARRRLEAAERSERESLFPAVDLTPEPSLFAEDP